MDITAILQQVQQYGYLALFLIYVVGLFIFPVPNEVLLMAGGLVATTRYVEPIQTFLVIFLCIIIHGTTLYWTGNYFNKRTNYVFRTALWQKRAEKGKQVLAAYGLKAALFSYFFPFIRHAVPLSIGMSPIRYRRFAPVAFSSAFVWFSLYFFLGFYYGRTIHDWHSFVQQLLYTLVTVILLGITMFVIKEKRKKKKKEQQI